MQFIFNCDLPYIGYINKFIFNVDKIRFQVNLKPSNGFSITTFSQKVRSPLSIEVTEAMAARCAIRFALELGLNETEFEGDLVIITKALNGDDYTQAFFGALIEDIKELTRNLHKFSFMHVKCIVNSVANAFTCLAQHCITPNVWLESISPKLEHLLSLDCLIN